MKVLNKIKIALAVLASITGLAFAVIPASAARELKCPDGFEYDSHKHICVMAETEEDIAREGTQTIMNWLFAMVSIASIPLTIAGIVLTIIGAKKQSRIKEENKKVKNGKKKKNGMLIAGIIMLCTGVVGFIVSLLGAAIVNFVFDGVFA